MVAVTSFGTEQFICITFNKLGNKEFLIAEGVLMFFMKESKKEKNMLYCSRKNKYISKKGCNIKAYKNNG
jgi:hypothetical protein